MLIGGNIMKLLPFLLCVACPAIMHNPCNVLPPNKSAWIPSAWIRHLLYADEAIETAIANKDIRCRTRCSTQREDGLPQAYGNKRGIAPNTEPMTVNTISIWLHAVNPCPLPSVPISWQNDSSASWIRQPLHT